MLSVFVAGILSVLILLLIVFGGHLKQENLVEEQDKIGHDRPRPLIATNSTSLIIGRQSIKFRKRTDIQFAVRPETMPESGIFERRRA
jgi:hypothetical protein